MTVKKSKKTVLEYDPLSWLKEDADDAPKTDKPAVKATKAKPKNAAAKSASVKKAASKKQVAKKATVKKVIDKKTVQQKPQSQAESTTDSKVVEGTNFGFFETEEPVQSETADASGDAIAMGSELTIKNIIGFKQHLDENLSQQRDIRLDSNDLQKIDTAGLQLLFSLQQSLRKSGRQIEWIGQREVVESAAKIIGMEKLFDNASASSEQDQGFGFF